MRLTANDCIKIFNHFPGKSAMTRKPVKKNETERSTGRVTARDVAERVGVSPSTVSRVLNQQRSDMISEETRQRVLKTAAQLGYTPDPIARALRGKKSNLLGLIVREIADPFFARFISELSVQARELNYHLVLGHAQSDPKEALTMTSVLDTRHTDGVIVLGDLKDDEAALHEMLEGKHAVVTVCRGPSPASLYTVNTDNYAGTCELLDHLYALGHRRFGFIDGGWLGDIRERREAFLSYIEQRRLTLRPEWFQAQSNNAEGGYRAMRTLIELGERPTAVFAADDIMAIGALKAVADAGLRVPDDFSVVGFDDIDLAQFLCPALTTMRQPIDAMSERVLSLMLELINDPQLHREQTLIRIPPLLVVRQSTGPAPDHR
jgi:DNA-binding LacI/PurR family transcriptional regulator